MQQIIPLIHGQYYHIYNRGINGESIFNETSNYEYFLKLYDKYINPVADTYAWCLMGNHFHLLVRIKEVDEFINDITPDKVPNPVRGDKPNKINKPPHLYFSHLFNAYSQAFNKKYERHGSLFERPFKRKLIKNETNLKQVVLYIHNNPLHHGFCDHPVEYAWSSFIIDPFDEINVKTRSVVIEWFGSKTEFDRAHIQNNNSDDLTKDMEE
jgi:putative transposase